MYTALTATSETLQAFLQAELGLDIGTFAAGTSQVLLNNPQEVRDGGRQGVSLWLYRIVRDDQRLNAPALRLDRQRSARVPLPLRLHYLLTPIIPIDNPASPTAEQTILGRVLQAFHDHPILRGTDLAGDFAGTDTEIIVRLEPLDLDQIARIWEAIDHSYQLSCSYEVTIVYIESRLDPSVGPPVQVVQPEFGVIVGQEAM